MNPSDSAETEISSPTSAYHATILEDTNAVFCSEWNQQKSTPVKRRLSGMDTQVFKAAREGNIDALGEHSDHLHQILTPTKNTVLHVYIACVGSARLTESEELLKSAEVVRKMLKMCQRLLLQPNESGDTALHLAARHGRADIVEVLIRAAKDWHGDLEEGISSKDVYYQFLIRRPNEEKNTALHEAVRFDHLDVVKILTREDPEFLYSANNGGETPLYMAAERGYPKLVFEMLDTCTNPSYQGPDGITALHAAATYGDEQLTRRLLEMERTLATASDALGMTPLHLAAAKGRASIVKQILECDKSTAYIGNMYKLTPVHYAAHAGHVDVLKQLIFYCPDSCELADQDGRNALHLAIIGNEEKVEEFVRKDPWLSSVLLNGKDSVGNTPLHQIATSDQEYDGLEFISDSRVDKMAFNKKNKNALDIILHRTHSHWKRNLIQGLRNFGARESQRVSRDKGGDKEGDRESKYKEIKESHMVVSALIATVTFAAGFTVPGGYQSEKGPDQGFAVLSRNAAFKAFVITNTLAMTLSSSAVMLRFLSSLNWSDSLLCVALNCTFFALIAMVAAFLTGAYAVLGDHSSLGLAIANCVLGAGFFSAICFVSISPAFSTFRNRVSLLHRRIITLLGLESVFFY